VEPDWIRKSYGRETTLQEDITDTVQMLEILAELADDVAATLKVQGARGRTITLKLKYFDFTGITRSITLPEPTDDAAEIMRHIPELLARTEAGERAVRLLGVAVSGLGDPERKTRAQQLKLPFE
jgi:DNA polymerase-4